jgi:hypothetical protein
MINKLFVSQFVVIYDVYEQKYRARRISAIDPLFIMIQHEGTNGRSVFIQYPIRDIESNEFHIFVKVEV